MDYYQNKSDNDLTSTSPNQHDYDELGIIYNHPDSTTTIAAAPPAMSQIDVTDRTNWGRLVRQSAREAVYALDFGGGHKIVTFVYLAGPENSKQ